MSKLNIPKKKPKSSNSIKYANGGAIGSVIGGGLGLAAGMIPGMQPLTPALMSLGSGLGNAVGNSLDSPPSAQPAGGAAPNYHYGTPRMAKGGKIKAYGSGGEVFGTANPSQLGVPAVTTLTPAQEIAYRKWMDDKGFSKWNDPADPYTGRDYDYRGFWKEEGIKGLSPAGVNGTHFTDKYKLLDTKSQQPEYQQLSSESKYASPFDKRGQGYWTEDDKFITDSRVDGITPRDIEAKYKYGKGGSVKQTTINVEGDELEVKNGSLIRDFKSKPPHPQNGIDPAGNVTATTGNIVIPAHMRQKYLNAGVPERRKLEQQVTANANKIDKQEMYGKGGTIKKYGEGDVISPLWKPEHEAAYQTWLPTQSDFNDLKGNQAGKNILRGRYYQNLLSQNGGSELASEFAKQKGYTPITPVRNIYPGLVIPPKSTSDGNVGGQPAPTVAKAPGSMFSTNASMWTPQHESDYVSFLKQQKEYNNGKNLTPETKTLLRGRYYNNLLSKDGGSEIASEFAKVKGYTPQVTAPASPAPVGNIGGQSATAVTQSTMADKPLGYFGDYKDQQGSKWTLDAPVADQSGQSSDTQPEKSKFDAMKYAPYVDNLVNLGVTLATPKIPKPNMIPNVHLDDRYAVEPRLNSIERNKDAAMSTIAGRTNSGSVLRANALQAEANAEVMKQQVYADRNNFQSGIRNQEALANNQVAANNTQLANQYETNRMLRKDDIGKRLSDNAANAALDAQGQNRDKLLAKADVDKVLILSNLWDKGIDSDFRSFYAGMTPELQAYFLKSKGARSFDELYAKKTN